MENNKLVFYNQRYNSIWVCDKDHKNEMCQGMWAFYTFKNNKFVINFINPKYLDKFNLIEIGEL